MKWTLLAIDSDCLPKVRYLKLKNSDNLNPVKPLPQVSKLPSVWFLIQTKISRLFISLQSCWKSYVWLPPPVPDILIWQQIIFPHLLAQNFHSLFLGPCARQVKSNWLYVKQSNRFCSTFLHKVVQDSVWTWKRIILQTAATKQPASPWPISFCLAHNLNRRALHNFVCTSCLPCFVFYTFLWRC